MTQKILIIEDETRIIHWVQQYFEQAGFHVMAAEDGLTGLQMILDEKPDLIILDLMLPGIDGIEICKMVREDSDVPIIMLTARGKEKDRIMGLDIGADDYVVKPFSPGELVARARSILRRTQGDQNQQTILTGGNIQLDLAEHVCRVAGDPVELSRVQFAILETLMRNSGYVLSRQQLLDAVFDGEYFGMDRTIDVHIRRLRQRVEANPSDPKHICTVFGLGYKFVENACSVACAGN